MSWQAVGDFRAKVRVRVGHASDNTEQQYLLHATPRSLRYTLRDTHERVLEQYDGFAHTKKQPHYEEQLEVSQLGTEAIPARLAFPLSLSVWDRPFDDYRFTGAVVPRDGHLELPLEHRRVVAESGVVVVNPRLRMAVRIDTPGLLIAYDDVE